MTARAGDAPSPGRTVIIWAILQGKSAGFASRLAVFAIEAGISLGVFLRAPAAITFAAKVLTGKNIAWNRGDIWVIAAYAVWGFIYFAGNRFLPRRSICWDKVCCLDRNLGAFRLNLADRDANLEDTLLVAGGDAAGANLGGEPDRPGERAVAEL